MQIGFQMRPLAAAADLRRAAAMPKEDPPPGQPAPPEEPPAPPQEPPQDPPPPTCPPPPECPKPSPWPNVARGAVSALPRLALTGLDGSVAWYAAANPMPPLPTPTPPPAAPPGTEAAGGAAAAASASMYGLFRVAGAIALLAAGEGTSFDSPKRIYKGVADGIAGLGLIAAANGAGPVGVAMAVGGSAISAFLSFQEGALGLTPPKQ